MNKVYAIIGPPASGKTSIVKALAEFGVPTLISHTTRPPKSGEKNGVEYYFVNKEAFAAMSFVEKASYADHLYGLTKVEVLNKIKLYPVSVVDIDLFGFEQLKKLLGERLNSIYTLVDKEVIINRYLIQGEENANIKQRLEYAEKNGEFNNWQIADYVVKNAGQLEVTVRQVLAIMGLVITKKLV
ncbi:MAG: guanylate kinase [Pelosinus sp.]|nr:guanylate kinase [Pelosinus sp.]